MFKKLLAALLSVVASGYVIHYGFWAMNQPSDFFYITGMFAIMLWGGFLYYCWKKILRRKKNESKNAGAGFDSGNNSYVDGMH